MEDYLTKEQLHNSNCCRLCGLGCRTKNDYNLDVEENYFPIFEKLEESEPYERLDVIVNRYLPLEVLESDPSYPRLICSLCYTSLKQTVEFFDKICEGQTLLSKILNSYRQKNNEVKSVIKKDESYEPNLSFSNDNPILNAPKKRGRPRTTKRDPLTIQSETKKSNEQTVLEPRTKRVSKLPARYSDQVLIDSFKTELLECEGDVDKTPANKKSEIEIKIIKKFKNKKRLNSGLFKTISDAINKNQNIPSDLKEKNFGLVIESESNVANEDLNNDIEGEVNANISPHLSSQEIQESSDEQEIDNISKEDPEYIDHNNVQLKSNGTLAVKKRGKYKKRPLKKNAPKFQCEQCPKVFNHSSSLLYHRIAVHDTMKKFKCSTCGRAFAHKQLLNNHMYVHSDEKFFACDICTAKFKSRASLYTHKKSIHSKIKEFTCDICGFQFNLKSSLTSHTRLHTGEKPFKCEFCQKTFAQRSNLREHRRTHTGEKPYTCTECLKSFTTGSQLRSHKFCHLDSKSHLCQICGKGFTHAENFRYHMRRHSGEKPIECQICKKKFAEPWAYRKHLRLHSGEKPYECKKCFRKFADPSNFAKHKKIHPDGGNSKPTKQKITHKINPINKAAVDFQINVDNVDGSVPTRSETVVKEHPVITEENETSILHIVASNQSYVNSEPNGQEQVEQIIYVYGDDGPIYTFAVDDGHEVSEMRVVNNPLNVVETLNDGLSSVNTNEFESHYYTIETIDGSTIAVPIQPTSITNGS